MISKLWRGICCAVLLCMLTFSTANAWVSPVVDGSVPPWITTPTCDLVDNMRALAGKITNDYPYGPGTNCVWSCSLALKGTPYGGEEGGRYTLTDDFINIAKKLGDWQEPPYKPQPGDIALVAGWYKDAWRADGHVVMVTENGGTIQSGSSTNGIGERPGPVEYAFSSVNKIAIGGTGPDKRPGRADGLPLGYITTSKYSGFARSIDMAINWGIEAMATMADAINSLIEQFALMSNEAMQRMGEIGTGIILLLIIIDFTTYLFFNGFDLRQAELISKLMKYTFLLFVFMNWAEIVNTVFLDFVESTSTLFSGGASTTENITQPQFLLKKGVEALSPALNFLSSAKGVGDFFNLPLTFFLIGVTFVTLGLLMASVIYLALIFIEFYLMAAFNAVFMIFPTLRFTKFIAEGGLGGLVQTTIKLFCAACLVYSMTGFMDSAVYTLDFPPNMKDLSDGTIINYLFLCTHINILVFMVLLIPGRISNVYGGNVSLPG